MENFYKALEEVANLDYITNKEEAINALGIIIDNFIEMRFTSELPTLKFMQLELVKQENVDPEIKAINGIIEQTKQYKRIL